MNLSKYQKIILLIIYFILCITTNIFYRKSLYDLSLSFQRSFQEKFNSQIIKLYFKIITHFGSQVFYIPVFIILFFFNPLNYFIYILSTLLIAIYFSNVLKIIYHNPRPFWNDKKLFKDVCEGGFGNPSGHALGSISTYLGISHLLIKNKLFKENIKFQIGLFVFTIFFILNIMLSRIYIGVHSIDQIIYGGLLGLGFYYLMFFIIKGYEFKPKEFLNKIYEGKLIMICVFLILLFFPLPFYFFSKSQYTDYNKYDQIFNEFCPKVKFYLKYFNNDLVGCLLILILLGMYLGLIFLKKKIDIDFPDCENKIINLNKTNTTIRLKRSMIFLVFSFPILLALIIPETNLFVIFVFKIGLSFFLTGFSIFGPGIYYGFVFSQKDENNSPKVEYNYNEITEINNNTIASPPEKLLLINIEC